MKKTTIFLSLIGVIYNVSADPFFTNTDRWCRGEVTYMSVGIKKVEGSEIDTFMTSGNPCHHCITDPWGVVLGKAVSYCNSVANASQFKNLPIFTGPHSFLDPDHRSSYETSEGIEFACGVCDGDIIYKGNVVTGFTSIKQLHHFHDQSISDPHDH